MRIFFSEFANIYETYTFAYAAYAVAESTNELPEIYRRGFLPYSGDITQTQEVFYLARSVRVNLGTFAETSENRRVARKIESLASHTVVHAKADFDLENAHFRNLCLSCSEERFSGGGLSVARFDYILRRETLTHIAVFSLDEVQELPVGYVLCAWNGEILHYWFAFYETRHAPLNLGKWMMATMLRFAKDNGLRYAYLGTAYGAKSLYKTADFKGIEWFDGDSDLWNHDPKALAELCRHDDARSSAQNANELPKSDRYKQRRSSHTKDDQTNHDEPAS